MTPDDDAVAALFDRWAADGVADDAADRHGRTAGRVLDAVDLEAGDRLLDLGTGNGWACRRAARRGVRAVGVDVSAGMLQVARRHGVGEGGPAGGDGGPAADASVHEGTTEATVRTPHPTYVRASFDALPLAEASIDAAFSMEALYYVDDLTAALEEVLRVLRPGGTLHAVVDYYAENEASHGWPKECGVPMLLLSETGWAEAFAGAGFADIATERVRMETTGDELPLAEDAWMVEEGSLHVTGRRPTATD